MLTPPSSIIVRLCAAGWKERDLWLSFLDFEEDMDVLQIIEQPHELTEAGERLRHKS